MRSVRVDTTVSREFWTKFKALKLERGMWAEAMRRGLALLFDEKEGHNLLCCEGQDVAVPMQVFGKVKKLVNKIEELAAENARLQAQQELRK